MLRLVSRWSGLVLPNSSLLANHVTHKCLNVSQPCRTAYNPFTFNSGDHDHETDEKSWVCKMKIFSEEHSTKLYLNLPFRSRQLKKQEKRKKLLQSSHSTHSHFDELEVDGLANDAVTFDDVRIVGYVHSPKIK